MLMTVLLLDGLVAPQLITFYKRYRLVQQQGKGQNIPQLKGLEEYDTEGNSQLLTSAQCLVFTTLQEGELIKFILK